ncbi:MAG: hypothetical protein M1816_003274 [Peltula sp. TS41687]|nr:MAG: hypothetical protein M1816_003274 [Peltula sp. TS41687]
MSRYYYQGLSVLKEKNILPRIHGPVIDLRLSDISPDLNPQSDTSEDSDNAHLGTTEVTDSTASSHTSTEDAPELLNLQVFMEDILQSTTEPENSQATTATMRPPTPQTAPESEPLYTNSTGRPISPAGHAWQNDFLHDSDFDEAMEYDSGKPIQAPRG